MTRLKTAAITFGVLVLAHTSSHALNPVAGWYGGVFLGPTYASGINFTLGTPITDVPEEQGNLVYSVLGGIGGEVGYRFCTKFRIEGEYFYNNNPFNKLQIGDKTIDSFSGSGTLHIGGDTNTGAILVNGFYDILSPSNDGYSKVFPYVGVGVGYAYVQNSLQFHYNSPSDIAQGITGALTEKGFTKAHSTYAGQVILGVGLFMDDFCWLSADLRYLSIGATTTENPYSTNSFTNKTGLLSAMISFNGAFDFG